MMNQGQARKMCFLLLVFLLLLITIATPFALGVHTSCCVPECIPCVLLAKVQDSLSALGSVLGLSIGLLALLVLLQGMAGIRWFRPNMESLVLLKARLNN